MNFSIIWLRIYYFIYEMKAITINHRTIELLSKYIIFSIQWNELTNNDVKAFCTIYWENEDEILEFLTDKDWQELIETTTNILLSRLLIAIGVQSQIEEKKWLLYSSDIEKIAEDNDCSYTDIKNLYAQCINNWLFKKELQSLHEEITKKVNEIKLEEEKRKVWDFNISGKAQRNLNVETLVALREKLYKEKQFFSNIYKKENKKNSHNDHFLSFINAAIEDTKKIRKIINYIISEQNKNV